MSERIVARPERDRGRNVKAEAPIKTRETLLALDDLAGTYTLAQFTALRCSRRDRYGIVY